MQAIEGGFKPVRSGEIASLIDALSVGAIGIRAARIYFAAHVATAARQAAAVAPGHKNLRRGGGTVKYSPEELARLTGLAVGVARKELRALTRANLLSFSTEDIKFSPTDATEAFSRSVRRLVPMPRRLLRHLAKCERKAELLTILAYCVRGLSLSRGGGIAAAGSVKAGWIAENFGLSLRSVRAERARLLKAGFLTPDTTSKQRKLNRTGAYFCINTAWSGGSQIAPPQPKNRTCFAPPLRNKLTPNGSRNQKPQSAEPSRVQIKHHEEKAKVLFSPTIRAVQREDLDSFGRMEKLYWQAVRGGIVKHSEASALNWVSAAVRAKTAAVHDPVRVFMGIVRKGLWHHITQADEDRARTGLNRYREQDPTLYSTSGDRQGAVGPTGPSTIKCRSDGRSEGEKRERSGCLEAGHQRQAPGTTATI